MFLEALRGHDEIHAIMFDDGVGDPGPRPDWIESLKWIPASRFPPPRSFGFWEDLLSATPRMLRGRKVSDIVEDISEYLDALKPEKLLVYRIEFAVASGLAGNPSVFLDVDDPEHIRRLAAARVRGAIDVRTRLDLLKLGRYERRVVRGCRQAFVCQEADARAFDPPATVIPNAVGLPGHFPVRDSASKTVLFVGNLSGGEANRDGLLWFVNHVWPEVIRQQPDSILRVVGKGAEKVLKDFDGDKSIQPVGFVADLSREYLGARLAIAPIRFGTGSRVKILEAMSYGCPVVSTPEGWYGISAIPGKDLVEARGATDMAKAIAEMIENEAWAHRVGSSGRGLVKRNYNREDVIKEIQRLIDARPLTKREPDEK